MKKIGYKLWLGMILLAASVLILLWLFQIVFLNRFYTDLKIKGLMEEGETVISGLEEYDTLEDAVFDSTLQNSMEELAYRQQLTLEIINLSRKALYKTDSDTGMMGRGMMLNANNEVYEIALSGKTAKIKTQHPRFGTDYMLIGLPIYENGTVAGVMILNAALAPVEDTAEILKKQLVWITLGLLIISVLISYFLSKSFTRPILRLHRVAEAYSRGDFNSRAEVDRRDELGQLARRINRMGEELAKNEQLRKDLIANVSHELRTPLSLIRGYAETLRDVTGDNPQKRDKQLGVIIEETDRLSRLVEDILVLSQFEAGAISLNIIRIPLREMLSDILKRYELGSSLKEIKLINPYEQELYVSADKGRVEQVIYNLINNAVNHTGEGGQVLVRVSDKPDTVKIEIADNGSGIEEEELKHVFERYYRGSKKEGMGHSGTGLGLAIVNSILTLHKVPFGVWSKVGTGTTFWFELYKDNSHTSF